MKTNITEKIELTEIGEIVEQLRYNIDLIDNTIEKLNKLEKDLNK